MCVYISGQEHNGQGFIQRGGVLGFNIFTQPLPPPKSRPQTVSAHAPQSGGPSSGKGWNVGMVIVKKLVSIVH